MSPALIDPRLADDDLCEMWASIEADEAAGRPVDAAFRAALSAEMARMLAAGREVLRAVGADEYADAG